MERFDNTFDMFDGKRLRRAIIDENIYFICKHCGYDYSKPSAFVKKTYELCFINYVRVVYKSQCPICGAITTSENGRESLCNLRKEG